MRHRRTIMTVSHRDTPASLFAFVRSAIDNASFFRLLCELLVARWATNPNPIDQSIHHFPVQAAFGGGFSESPKIPK